MENRWFGKFTIVYFLFSLFALPVQAADPTTQPLLRQSDLTYVGSFALPPGSFGSPADTFEYSGGFAAGQVYNDPINGKSLFLSGYLSTGYLSDKVSWAQVTIPQTLKDPNVVGESALATASAVQGFNDPSNGLGSQALVGGGVGSLVVYGGKLIGTESTSYDANCSQTKSAWVAPINFSQRNQATGPYTFNSPVGPRYVAGGYMTLIPSEWQSALGGKVVTGNGPQSIISCGSEGPSLHVIDADALINQPAATTPINAVPLVYYVENETQATLGHWDSTNPNQIVNGKKVPSLTVTDPYGRGTFTVPYAGEIVVRGVLFPEGTRSVLFFGRRGLGPFCYGNGMATNPPNPPVDAYITSGNNASTDATGRVITLPNVNTASAVGIEIWLKSQTSPNSDGSHPGTGYIISAANSGTPTASVTVDTAFAPNLTNQPYNAGIMNCYDPDASSKGTHAYPYTEFVWAYDVNDLVAAKRGQKNPWDVMPYTGWAMKTYKGGGSSLGVAWDPATRLAYVIASCTVGQCAPLVHVYRVGQGSGTGTGTGTLTLNLPRFLAINGQINADYKGDTPAATFAWSFTPTTLQAQGSRLQGTPSPGAYSLEPGAVRAPSASFTTASPQANLSLYALGLGSYRVDVQAFDSATNSLGTATASVTLVPADLSGVRVYPNPWRSDRHSVRQITFDQLTVNTTVKIFTVSGRWAKTLPTSSTSVTWDLTNDSGDRVASGMYMYLITTDAGQKKTGQVAVIK